MLIDDLKTRLVVASKHGPVEGGVVKKVISSLISDNA